MSDMFASSWGFCGRAIEWCQSNFTTTMAT